VARRDDSPPRFDPLLRILLRREFYDNDALRDAEGNPGRCWSCGARIQLPFRMRAGRATVMLNHDTRLFPHHIDDQKPNDFSRPIAEVTVHPDHPDVWGLTNLGDEKWSFCKPQDPVPAEVLPGRTLRLDSGLRINFGRLEGEIRI
jgi:eukaryotic-like serine/threonine-protein kinase